MTTPLMSQIAKFDALRTIDSSTFTGSYQAVGTKLSVNARIVIFQNNSNQTVTISTDGTTDMLQLLTMERVVFDLNTNHSLPLMFSFPPGTQFYAKGSAGTGNFNISLIYGA